MRGTKASAAWVSVASNSLLIAAKLAAGAITGSIAIVTEAAHSAIDLVASIIALISVRKADEPPDPEHPYGHERFENLAAAIEGMLIVVGAGIIVFAATRKLVVGASVDHLGVGIVVIAVSAVINALRRGLPRAARPRPGLGRARGRRGPPGYRLADLRGRPGRPPSRPDHGHCGLRPDRRTRCCGGHPLLRHSDPLALGPGAGRRGAAARAARRHRGRRLPASACSRRRSLATTSSAPGVRVSARSSTFTSSSAPGRRSRTLTTSRIACVTHRGRAPRLRGPHPRRARGLLPPGRSRAPLRSG